MVKSAGFNTNWNWLEESPKVVRLKKKKHPTAKQKKALERRNKRKEHKKQMLALMDTVRQKLKQHFSLQKYPTDMAICLCIHNDVGWEMPTTKKHAHRMMREYYKYLGGEINERKRNPMPAEQFYNSQKWKELRYIALKDSQGKCCLCGSMARDGVELHVDHIQPRSLFPELQYSLGNLQVLCSDCNTGKSNYDDTDWKKHWDSI